MRHSKPWFFFLAMFSLSLLSCSDTSSPTGNTPLGSPASSTPGTLGASSLTVASPSSANLNSEEFNCSHLQEWFVRFSEPGFHNFNHVGIFYKYVGAPPGLKKLQIYWDEENEPTKSSYVQLGTGAVDRHEDNLFDLSGVVEHVYENIDELTKKRVRVNLIVEGMTGNCATVRRVTVTPGAPALAHFVLESITRPGLAESILTTDVPNNSFTLSYGGFRDSNCMVYTFHISDGSMRAVTATLSDGSATGDFTNVWGNGGTGMSFGPRAGPAMMASPTSNTDSLFRALFATSNVHHFFDLKPTASGALTITLSAPGVRPLTITGVINP